MFKDFSRPGNNQFKIPWLFQVFHNGKPNFHDQTFCEISVYKWHKWMRDNSLTKRINKCIILIKLREWTREYNTFTWLFQNKRDTIFSRTFPDHFSLIPWLFQVSHDRRNPEVYFWADWHLTPGHTVSVIVPFFPRPGGLPVNSLPNAPGAALCSPSAGRDSPVCPRIVNQVKRKSMVRVGTFIFIFPVVCFDREGERF